MKYLPIYFLLFTLSLQAQDDEAEEDEEEEEEEEDGRETAKHVEDKTQRVDPSYLEPGGFGVASQPTAVAVAAWSVNRHMHFRRTAHASSSS